MSRILFILTPLFVLWTGGCRPDEPEEIPLPTQICVQTFHHHQPVPWATVYVKYNADSFPGYNQPPAYYDASFKTGANARGCLDAVPEGQHWLVAFGYDSVYFPHDVKGSLLVKIDLSGINGTAKLDTVMQISEEH